ncbi:3-hydroxyacyl-ACP dehydratase [Photobacterium makurazakiensis]|uniref:3-hydroxyacyl-ACP dehydratase FabZ family protein n=1 Tax=Photobacterium makurazakiensis TaxID=2910234 RepID=UPI003D122526
MMKRKPTIIDQQIIGNTARLTLHVDHDIEDFQGHFPSHPVLPGVSQIDWAVSYAVQLLDTPPYFTGMEVLKFQEPILPGMSVLLELRWLHDKGKLQFCYSSGQVGDSVRMHASGRLMMGDNQLISGS